MRAGANVVVALLRGINVGGNKKVPMTDLRTVATKLGCVNPVTYIQSGNLVVGTELGAAAFEVALEHELKQKFGFEVLVIARSGAQWLQYAKGSPFKDAEEARPNMLLLGLSKIAPQKGSDARIQAAGVFGERAVLQRDALWIDFPQGSGRSKITPAVLDRLVGSTVTTRNWRTVQEIGKLVEAAAAA